MSTLRHDPESARVYARRINRVLDHIDRHLDRGELDLGQLADIAHFSPFHFLRLFSAWMGETPGDYLRRRRMEQAALLLAHRRQVSVTAVALEVGFGSAEAFARAFKLHFGKTPTAWRQAACLKTDDPAGGAGDERNPDQAQRNRDQDAAGSPCQHEGFFQNQPEPFMQAEVKTLSPVRIAYMRHIGPYGPEVSRFWQETFLPWRHAAGLSQASCYGIAHDHPAITPPDKCRYDACVAVPAGFEARGPVNIGELPGGPCAVARFRGKGEAIGEAWTALFRDWLPRSGFQPDARPIFEHYAADAAADPVTGMFECELCLPVRML